MRDLHAEVSALAVPFARSRFTSSSVGREPVVDLVEGQVAASDDGARCAFSFVEVVRRDMVNVTEQEPPGVEFGVVLGNGG